MPCYLINSSMTLLKTQSELNRRIRELDGLRGIAVILVVIAHYQNMLSLPDTTIWMLIQHTINVGWLGVDIFFVLSGYLITSILLEHNIGWQRFYTNRAFRILPAFIVVFSITIYFFHSPWLSSTLLYIFFLGNFTIFKFREIAPLYHFWSLSVEEQYYVFWPLIVKRMSKSKVFIISLIIAILSSICRIILFLLHVNFFIIYKSTFSHLDGIALGSAIAVAPHLPSINKWLRIYWKLIATISFMTLVSGFFLLKMNYVLWNGRTQATAIPTISIFIAMLIFARSQNLFPPAMSTVLNSHILVYFGLRSYGLYLIHYPVLYYAQTIIHNHPIVNNYFSPLTSSIILTIFTASTSVALAEISWRCIEQPAQKLKSKLASQ